MGGGFGRLAGTVSSGGGAGGRVSNTGESYSLSAPQAESSAKLVPTVRGPLTATAPRLPLETGYSGIAISKFFNAVGSMGDFIIVLDVPLPAMPEWL